MTEGPISENDLNELYRQPGSGVIDSTLICEQGIENWVEYREVFSYPYFQSPTERMKREAELQRTGRGNNRKAHRSTSSGTDTVQNVPILVGIALFVIFIIVIPQCDSGAPTTDGVYESATEKLDKGLPLNEREAERIDDIINYKRNKEIEEIEKKHY